jgi:signal transduction histidine kinase
MRLFTRYNQVLLATALLGLCLIGYLFFLTMGRYLNQQVDRYLVEEQLEVKDNAHAMKGDYAHEVFKDLVIDYQKIHRVTLQKHFDDTIFFNPKKQVKESARYLKQDLLLNGQPFRVTVIVSKIAHSEQIKGIFFSIMLPVAALFIVLLLINRFMIARLWKPFKELLLNLKSFNLNQQTNFRQVETPILEFRELNDALLEISQRIRSEYREIKLFTENASHEMMTPIAVINSKLEMMLQSNELGEEQSQNIHDLYKATAKLTKLNQSLLLLVKIDNKLLRDQQDVDLKKMIEERIGYFHELLQNKQITIELHLEENTISMSRFLAETMIDNLIGNAIRHNYKDGRISISLNKATLSISNTSTQSALDPSHTFERFYKGASSEGMGLGLAIVKQIVTVHKFEIGYSYQTGLHTFSINF